MAGRFSDLEVVAEKKGVRIYLVPALPNGSIMPSDERKKLEKALTPLAAEHLLIFADAAKTRQIWLWTSRLACHPGVAVVCGKEEGLYYPFSSVAIVEG